MNIDELHILMKVGIAALLTGVIGFEREIHRKPAGFRTNMIVGSASALITSISFELVDFMINTVENPHSINADPIRVIQSIVVGISFIGAGTILQVKQEDKVRYLTSAASILFSAAVGITVGIELYLVAGGATLLILIINLVMGYFEEKVMDK